MSLLLKGLAAAARRGRKGRNSEDVRQASELPEPAADASAVPTAGLPQQATTDLYEQARITARTSGRVEPHPPTKAIIEEQAERTAAQFEGSRFDPEANADDELKQTRFERDMASEDTLGQQVTHAKAAERDRLAEFRTLGEPPKPVSPPLLAGLLGVVAIALTIAPTFHDLVIAPLIADPTRALVASIAAGMMLGGILVWAILGRASLPGSQSIVERLLWIAVGLGFGLGLYLMRLSVVGDGDGRLLAAGFAMVEAVIVLLLDLYAAGLRRAWERYTDRIEPFHAAKNLTAAAAQYRAAREQDLRACEARIAAHLADVGHREQEARRTPEMRRAARAIALAGYQRGLEENRGHVADAAFLPPVAAEVRNRRPGMAKDAGAAPPRPSSHPRNGHWLG